LLSVSVSSGEDASAQEMPTSTVRAVDSGLSDKSLWLGRVIVYKMAISGTSAHKDALSQLQSQLHLHEEWPCWHLFRVQGPRGTTATSLTETNPPKLIAGSSQTS
jgi:hypothetical protein